MSPQQDALGGQPGRSSSLTGMSRIAGGPGTKKVRTPSGVPPTGARLPRVPGAGRGLTVPRGAGGGRGVSPPGIPRCLSGGNRSRRSPLPRTGPSPPLTREVPPRRAPEVALTWQPGGRYEARDGGLCAQPRPPGGVRDGVSWATLRDWRFVWLA